MPFDTYFFGKKWNHLILGFKKTANCRLSTGISAVSCIVHTYCLMTSLHHIVEKIHQFSRILQNCSFPSISSPITCLLLSIPCANCLGETKSACWVVLACPVSSICWPKNWMLESTAVRLSKTSRMKWVPLIVVCIRCTKTKGMRCTAWSSTK